MPETLKFENFPEVLLEYHIEPFREEYIPGSSVLCHEGTKSDEVFFHIPKPIALINSESKLEELKQQIHSWWQNTENPA